MFSQTRQSLLPHTEVLEKLPWTIINSRTSSSEVLRWLKDPHGINTIYGDSFSATMIPLSSGVNLGNEVGADGDKHVLSPVVEEGPNDGMKPDDEGRKEDGSITQNDDITVNDHQGIKLINGIERTTPKSNTDNTTEHIPEEPSTDHPKSSNPDNLSTNPITTPKEISQVYVALTVPSKWLSPSYCHQMSKCTCEPTIHSLFLRNLENSDGWGRRKGYQMYSMRRTFAGRGRVVLLGDAGHGMPPFCGAGAGSAVVDSIELVRELERGLDNIDYTLQEFRTQSQSRNDPLIKESNRLLWLAQGETELSMLARKVVFWGLEMGEVFSGKRRKLEEQLRKSIEEDESKGMR
ncbi:hypothetical protein I302_101077 [Kwoniella bestiolae CBS 10118]|uniref:FAD-binding domain-containing protein n=1 Tax=Kwoniella bestiolae CBS 10118 TaxID=1296100 RepID=A0A1B9G6U6_9TREE|nr:hypothetical protein I302_04453 [Kwoniella bestiolae CBS 10118]OCF26764.1 hypothetical protein I302_04453 [Kwoniella bestiolae CBS 10118]